MSWVEVRKAVNDNFNKPLNKKLEDFAYAQIYVFENSATFVPPKSGLYKVICVGGGYNDSRANYIGGAGGVAIKNVTLNANASYEISIETGTAVFNNYITGNTATRTGTISEGGTASGGDFNYTGGAGMYVTFTVGAQKTQYGASVGVYLNGLSQRYVEYFDKSASNWEYSGNVYTGYGLLGFGYGQGVIGSYYNSAYTSKTTAGNPGVIIIPLDVDA